MKKIVNKIFNKQTLLKLLPYIVVFSIATFLFFQTHVAFLLDSEFYYKNATVILGFIDKTQYFAIRGFGYPLYLSLFIKIFGNNFLAITISAYVVYILIILLALYIINLFIKNCSLVNKIVIFILFLLIMVFNTLIIGYSSLILTENISILIMEIAFILLYKWINMDLIKHKIKSIIYVLIFAILMIYIYQCKQTMAAYMFIMMFIIVIFSSIKKKNIKDFLFRFGAVIICLMLTYGQISVWGNYLSNIKQSAGVKGNETNSIGMLSGNLLNGSGISITPASKFCNKEFIEKNEFLTNKEKSDLLKQVPNNCENIVYMIIYNSLGDIVEHDYEVSNGHGLMYSISLLTRKMIQYPQLIFGHYYDNYMWMINVYDYKVVKYHYEIVKEFTTKTKENGPNGMFTFNYSNTLWRDVANYGESHIQGISNFSKNISNGKVIEYLHNNTSKYYLELFKYTYLIIPFIFILSCILYIKSINKEYSNLLIAILTLSGSSFGFALFLAFTGQTIDRYAYVSYPLALISIILCFISCSKNLVKKNDK